MFEIERDMLNEEKLIYKKGDDVDIFEHDMFNGTLKKDGKKVGIWNGKKVIKDDDSSDDSSDSESSDGESSDGESSDSESSDDESSDNKKQRGGSNLNELNKFKRLLNGGGIPENLSDNLELVGGGEKFAGYGFTFF